jgi:hypothetical protein
MPIYLDDVGQGLAERLKRCEDNGTGDFEVAERCYSEAAELTEGHPYQPVFLTHLGELVMEKATRDGGDVEALSKSIELSEKAAALLTPRFPLAPGLPYQNLANAYHRRFKATGNIEDGDKAVAGYQIAISKHQPGEGAYGLLTGALRNILHERFDVKNGPVGLEGPIARIRAMLVPNPTDSVLLTTLGECLALSSEYRRNWSSCARPSDVWRVRLKTHRVVFPDCIG